MATRIPNKVLDNLPLMRSDYSDRISVAMARFSDIAYVDFKTGTSGNAELKRLINSSRMKLVDAYSENTEHDTSFYAATTTGANGFSVIAFTGTEDRDDWDTNAQIKLVKISGSVSGRNVRVHKGFYGAFKEVEKRLKSLVRELEVLNKPIFLTGHSLGGALALISSARFSSDKMAACYTYGMPRTGNKALGSEVKVPHFRVIYGADIVAWNLLYRVSSYRHTGIPRLIDYENKLFKTARASDYISLRFRYPFKNPIKDHSISKRYAPALQLIANERSNDPGALIV